MYPPEELTEREKADDAEWRRQQTALDPRRTRWVLGTSIILISAVLVSIIGFWLGREAPMIYQDQDKNQFQPSVARPGQTILICLSPEWKRSCRAVIHERLNCVDPDPPEGSAPGAQHERTIGTRPITLPPVVPIFLKNKCREFTVPDSGCDDGPAAYSGLFEGWCNPADYAWPYRARLGPIPLTIKK